MTSTATIIANLQAEVAAAQYEKAVAIEAKERAEQKAAAFLETLELVAWEVTDGVRPTSADSHLPQDIVRAVHAAIAEAKGESHA